MTPYSSTGSSRGRRWVLVGITAVGLVLRLAPLLRHDVVVNPDSGRYIELAQGLRHGCGFARWTNGACDAAVETFRTPGYPLFLAAMPNLRTAVAIQGIAGAGVGLLAGLLVWQCWGFAAGMVAELIVAGDIPSILFGAMISSDGLFQALITTGAIIGLWIIRRGLNDRMAVAAILTAATIFGAAILVRPIGIVLPIFSAAPSFLLPRSSWRRVITIALLAFAIPSLFMFGWMLRNEQRTGVWTLSTVGPVNLYFYRAAGVLWYRGDKSFPAVQEELRRAIGLPPGGNSDAPPALEPALIDRASQIIRNDPAAAIIMTLRCFAWLAIVPERADLNAFLGTNAGANSYFAATGNVTARIQETLRSPLLTALVALQFVMMVFVWVGVARAAAGLGHKTALERSMILLPFLFTIAFLGLASGAESVARFRTPVAPMLAILAAAGWCGQFRIAKEGEVLGAAAAQSGRSV
jgi:hypothetical protein